MVDTDYDPRVRVPDPYPVGPPGKVVTALVAWLSLSSPDGRPEGEISRRWLALNLARTDDKAASGLLRRLCKPDSKGKRWLALSKPSVGLRANRYTLGRAAKPNASDWADLGERLFGYRGYLRHFLRRGAIRHRELNITGCALLGYLMVNGPSTKPEIYAGLREFFGLPTIRKMLEKTSGIGLVMLSGGEYSLVRNFEDALSEYEHERELDLFIAGKEAIHAEDRAEYAKYVQSRTYLIDFKNSLRSLPCTYCGETPIRGSGTIEHFPPRHWGGSDRYSLLFPACATCNMDDAPLIKRTQPLETPFPSETLLDIPGDIPKFLREFMYEEHDRYAIDMASNSPEVARERIERIFPSWVAHRNQIAYTVDETLDDNSLVGFIRMTSDDPDFLFHCRNVRRAVDACKDSTT